jgi:hypothetical protein
MEAKLFSRPALGLLSSFRALSHHGTVARRSHQTTARTKRALNVPPHASFLVHEEAAKDEIIFNAPASQAQVYHTPFKFLPKSDPRRRNNLASLFGAETDGAEQPHLPPTLNVKSRNPSYHLTKEDVAEIRRLRAEDPKTWSVNALAKKFKCSEVFITICTPAPREHKELMARKLQAIQASWGPKKTKARADRKRRREMIHRGEL